jgi:nicotinate-nucleotide adenylyltransferase
MSADPGDAAREASNDATGAPRRIGVFGGTFDPVHRGHLASAVEIAAAHDLHPVLLVLSADPPHKRAADAASAADRWRMLQLAVGDAEARGEAPAGLLVPCDVEIRRAGPSWTVDTLRQLAAEHPGAELFFIVGADAYADIETWKQPGELLALANVIVTSRPGSDSLSQPPIPPIAARDHARYDPVIGVYVHTSGHTLRGHRIRGIEVSATGIRRDSSLGKPLETLTGDSVARYIREHGLYR